MATWRLRVCAAVTLLGALAITSSRAQDLSVPDRGSGLAIDPKDVRQSDAGAGQVRGDDASRITDLESTRAVLDRRAGPALSLSVTGWVAEQVIHAH
jgi:hypothetical protein